MNRLFGLAVLAVTLATGSASAQNLQQRQYQLQRRLDYDLRDGRISHRDGANIAKDLDKIDRRIRHERYEDRGRIDRRDWERLNRDLDRIEERLARSERYSPRYDRRRGEYGYNGRDRYYDDRYRDPEPRRW